MPKRTDLRKILVIGSGPIVIGQAAEFDYAGTQACLALKEEGYEVVLCNSNPATIMTDTVIADKVYMEPLTLEYVAKIIRYERPDAIVPGIGGQTGLNLAMQLKKKGVLRDENDEDSVIPSLNYADFRRLEAEGVIQGGMIPKLQNAFEALRAGVCEVVIMRADTIGGNEGTRIRIEGKDA